MAARSPLLPDRRVNFEETWPSSEANLMEERLLQGQAIISGANRSPANRFVKGPDGRSSSVNDVRFRHASTYPASLDQYLIAIELTGCSNVSRLFWHYETDGLTRAKGLSLPKHDQYFVVSCQYPLSQVTTLTYTSIGVVKAIRRTRVSEPSVRTTVESFSA